MYVLYASARIRFSARGKVLRPSPNNPPKVDNAPSTPTPCLNADLTDPETSPPPPQKGYTSSSSHYSITAITTPVGTYESCYAEGDLFWNLTLSFKRLGQCPEALGDTSKPHALCETSSPPTYRWSTSSRSEILWIAPTSWIFLYHFDSRSPGGIQTAARFWRLSARFNDS